MITPMMQFTDFLIRSVADVLSVEPMLDLFSIIIVCGVCKLFKTMGS